MNTQSVWISITGVQRIGEESDTLELNTTGRMCRTPDGFRLTYEESEATGMAGVTTTLTVNPQAVTMQREGALNSLMVLEKEKRTQCQYDTGYGCLSMSVYTGDIRMNLDDSGGDFAFHYTVSMNQQYTSSHDLHVTVRPAGSRPEEERRRNE